MNILQKTQTSMAETIVKQRKSLHMRQTDILDYTDISSATLNNIETAKGNPTLKVLVKLLDLLGLELVVQVKGSK